MRTTLLRLAVALATFILGVTLATLWLGLFGSGNAPAYKGESCRFRERAVLAPVPPPPAFVPVAPAPPAVETLRAETCEGTAAGRTVSGGILNGKAISKPAPKYPVAAMAERATGTVVVQIVVDECGDVEEAEAISGHPLLREAAAQAAYESRFTPTRISGDPVKVTGTITYRFEIH
jgi:TonB family protein